MYCKKCGAEINDDAVICTKCGCSTEEKPQNTVTVEPDEPKTAVGILMGLFLGIIGLIIGLCLYKENTIARKTFLKAWGITFGVTIVASIIIYFISMAAIVSSVNSALDSLYNY